MSPQGRRNASRGKISREAIVAAALEVSDSSAGLDAVTVRSLATKLGTGTMTLYGYFRSKDEILDAMADHVMSGIELPPVEDETPEQALRAVAQAFVTLMTEHPSVSWLLSSRVTRSHASLKAAMEDVLQRLVNTGIPPETAVRCYGLLIQFALGFAAYQAPRQWGAASGDDGAELRRQQEHYWAGLPATEFPLVVALAPQLVMLPTEDQFDWGVELLVQVLARALEADAQHS
ncbi:TetR/AcrR family transcriptional regulator [Nocardioides carbamazepini]|uniref:TetR/AcrR family transcriptional regulator n=1 Tax=Nocardioides carbamazepini TaxID=2854259 RepID=UPI00214A20F1|nr:TetR/AcrR family transcriptional regulator [Nocardioides carbamazepini]MCR1784389.1 TetR/AcrR family transcriptional regulator [Nocardioides carbamazepini]